MLKIKDVLDVRLLEIDAKTNNVIASSVKNVEEFISSDSILTENDYTSELNKALKENNILPIENYTIDFILYDNRSKRFLPIFAKKWSEAVCNINDYVCLKLSDPFPISDSNYLSSNQDIFNTAKHSDIVAITLIKEEYDAILKIPYTWNESYTEEIMSIFKENRFSVKGNDSIDKSNRISYFEEDLLKATSLINEGLVHWYH